MSVQSLRNQLDHLSSELENHPASRIDELNCYETELNQIQTKIRNSRKRSNRQIDAKLQKAVGQLNDARHQFITQKVQGPVTRNTVRAFRKLQQAHQSVAQEFENSNDGLIGPEAYARILDTCENASNSAKHTKIETYAEGVLNILSNTPIAYAFAHIAILNQLNAQVREENRQLNHQRDQLERFQRLQITDASSIQNNE